jgi:Cu2+-exporting ATPase
MTCCSSSGVPNQTALRQRLDHERLLAASHQIEGDMMQTDLVVPSMHCAACIRTIETGLDKLPGVHKARANLSTRRVSIQWTPSAFGDTDPISELANIGFEATLYDPSAVADDGDSAGRQLLICLAVAGFAAANIMLLSVSVWAGAEGEAARLFQLISGLIAVPAVMFAGRPFYASALSALRKRRLNMDVPISLAVLLALGMSIYEALFGHNETWFDASVSLLFFLLIGRYLDHMMRERARGAILQLSRLMPSGATRLSEDGSLIYVPSSELVPGDRIVVAAGDRMPVDGVVISGMSDLDRSLVTGESAAVQAAPGMEVEAGVLNLTGPVTLKVLRPAAKSFVANVMELMETAAQSSSRQVRLADRAAGIYAPVVHILSAAAFLGWLVYTGGDWHTSLYVAIAVLIITCPCALGLAVPIAQVVAANRLFRSGIMVKDGAALERLTQANTVVFDKTGTLTLGEPRISSIIGGTDQDHALASVLARLSTHPAARAAATLQDKQPGLLVSDVREHPGFGLEASWKGKPIRLGRRDWVSEIARPVKDGKPASDMEVCFAVQGGELVRFALADTLRADAATTASQLRRMGLRMEILSGDNLAPVHAVAAQLGIETARAGMTPAQKTAHVQKLEHEGKRVLYVGDGINDAPALAAASVSMAPASGSDIGRSSASLVFTGKGLDAIPVAIKVARATSRIVNQNFALALTYNAIAIPIAVLGYATPLIAAIAMSSSSILVVANSLRLNLVARHAGNTVQADPDVDDGTTGQAADVPSQAASANRNTTTPPRLEAVK